MTEPNTTATERFLAATDRPRWWTTPELTVPLVSSGLWAESGLGDPLQQHIVAMNGVRRYSVEVDDEDWTDSIDQVLASLAPDLDADPSLTQPALVRLPIESDAGPPIYIYKRLSECNSDEWQMLKIYAETQMLFDSQMSDEYGATEDLMRTLGAKHAGEVLPDTGLVEFIVAIPNVVDDDDGA